MIIEEIKEIKMDKKYYRNFIFLKNFKQKTTFEALAKEKDRILKSFNNSKNIRNFAFQFEKGKERQIRHVQGFVLMGGKVLPANIGRILGSNFKITPMLQEHYKAYKLTGNSYFLKDEGRILGPFTKENQEKNLYDYAVDSKIVFNKFQDLLEKELNLLKEKREVLFVVDKKRSIGKSFYCFYREVTDKYFLSCETVLKTPQDFLQYFASRDKVANSTILERATKTFTFCLDLSAMDNLATPGGEASHVGRLVSSVLEQLANGVISESRYNAKKIMFIKPKVLVFTNHELPTATSWKLSEDRIVELNTKFFGDIKPYRESKRRLINKY